MKIDMNKAIVGLDGKELEGSNLGQLIAQVLVQSNKGDALKLWHWAQKLYSKEELELDPSDLEILKNFIKESETLTILAKAQALACL